MQRDADQGFTILDTLGVGAGARLKSFIAEATRYASFTHLLPPKPVDEKTRQMGQVLLKAMGVKVIPLKR